MPSDSCRRSPLSHRGKEQILQGSLESHPASRPQPQSKTLRSRTLPHLWHENSVLMVSIHTAPRCWAPLRQIQQLEFKEEISRAGLDLLKRCPTGQKGLTVLISFCCKCHKHQGHYCILFSSMKVQCVHIPTKTAPRS